MKLGKTTLLLDRLNEVVVVFIIVVFSLFGGGKLALNL